MDRKQDAILDMLGNLLKSDGLSLEQAAAYFPEEGMSSAGTRARPRAGRKMGPRGDSDAAVISRRAGGSRPSAKKAYPLGGPDERVRAGKEEAAGRASAILNRKALQTLERLISRREITRTDLAVIKAIIYPKLRPVFDIKHDDFDQLPAEWDLLNRQRQVLGRMIRAIGRIDLVGSSAPEAVGTAFVVGPDLIITNRHVAERFTFGVGQRPEIGFRSGAGATIDFKQEMDVPDQLLLEIKAPVLVKSDWDIALLEVKGLPAGIRPLSLVRDEPGPLALKMIAVIGYPALNPKVSRKEVEDQRLVFRDRFDIKRLQPGRIMEESIQSVIDHYDVKVEALAHDSSTLANNSGSAIIDVEAGHVLGVHFQGQYLKANFAIPAWGLASDQRLIAAGLCFV